MKKTIRASLIGLSGGLHGVAVLLFYLELPRTDIPEAWVAEASILLGMSFLVSAGAIAASSVRTRNLLLGLQLIFLILVGIPEGTSLAIETVLTALLVLECVLLNRMPWRLVFPISTIAIVTALQTADIAFLGPIAHPPAAEIVSFALILTVAAALIFIVSGLLDRAVEKDALVERLDTTIARLTAANVGFQRYASEVESESVGRERKRISSEIHDTVGYTITTLIMLMEAASDLAEGGRKELKALLKQGIDQSIYSLDEIRRSLRELRAMEVPRLQGLRAIKHMMQAFEEATRISVSVDFSNVTWNFDEEVNEVFYRMIQESLANAFRHGGATEVVVSFAQSDHELRVSIRDNGKGSSEVKEGIGLSGMRDRIARLNGRLQAETVADGFVLSATLPLGEWSADHGH